MPFRFWRRIRLAPGVTLNLSRSGGSLSFGPRGARVTVGRRGVRATAGVPGTGLFYTTTVGHGRGRGGAGGRRRGATGPASAAPVVAPEDRLSMGFFRRLVTPAAEEALVDGCRELAAGREARALDYLRPALHLPDGACLAGFLALKQGLAEESAAAFEQAVAAPRRLGSLLSKYGVAATFTLAITEEVAVHVGAGLRGCLLGMAEAYQRLGRWEEARGALERLLRLEPDAVVVRLSLAELLMEAHPDDRATLRRIVRLAEGVENGDEVHAALLLYRGRALHRLGLLEAARTTLTAALRRRKDRSPELLHALRYERALVYDTLGQHARARSDFERLYGEAPDYGDVAARLEGRPRAHASG